MTGQGRRQADGSEMRRFALAGPTLMIFAALVMSLSACTPPREQPRPSEAATGGQTAPTGYAQPRDPCSGVSATLTRTLGLKDPSRQVYDRFQQDPSQPDDPVVAYDDVGCEWTVANPGRSPDGRANQMTASISYSVIDTDRASAGQVAALVLDQSRQRYGKDQRFDVVRNAETLLAGRDGYYIYAHEKSATGMGALTEAAVRVENAVIVVRFAGADLRVDRSKPVGLQLTTRPVDERRLRPTVLALLPAALEHLTGNGKR
jgi:hypothetical protein